jgi:hypothetical protein
MPKEKTTAEAQIERKSFIGIELKADKPGAFVARIATLNVVDKDGDLTPPGAFPNGKSILISSYMHGSWMGELPVGKGVIRESGTDVLVDGEFNLNSETGKEHYETVKFAPELQEWSYGFKVLDADYDVDVNGNHVDRVLKSLDVFEASPVLRGAGMNTGTLSIKSEKDGVTYKAQTEAVLATVADWAIRTKALAALKKDDGRALSPANGERVMKVLAEVETLATEIKNLLAQPVTEPDNAAVERLRLKFTKQKFEMMEVLP